MNIGRISCWILTVVLVHAADSDWALPSKMNVIQARGDGTQDSEVARWFQSWSINSGKSVRGVFATTPGAFKYSSVVEVNGIRCSGAVISVNWVLSSCHCFSLNIGNARVLAGGVKYENESDVTAMGVQSLKIKKLLLYKKPQESKDLCRHDVLLVRTVDPGFVFDEFVSPIHLTDQRRFSSLTKRTCFVVGFSADNLETITMANLLQWCPKQYQSDNMICAEESRAPCLSDAGAPIVCRNLLVGMTNMAGLLPNNRCQVTKGISVKHFTFVGYYSDWIAKKAPIQFGVWRSGTRGHHVLAMPGGCGILHVAVFVIHIWK